MGSGLLATSLKSTVCKLHACLGHMNVDDLKGLLRQGLIKGVEVINLNEDFECQVCILAKKSHKPVLASREGEWKTTFDEEIHSDVWGPALVKTLGHWYYYVSFTDDWSCWTTAYLMYAKSNIFTCYKSFAAWVKTQLGVEIKCLHSYQGGEYLSHEFINFLDKCSTEQKMALQSN
jgi:GAG-pre-integrase domain